MRKILKYLIAIFGLLFMLSVILGIWIVYPNVHVAVKLGATFYSLLITALIAYGANEMLN